MIPLSDPDIQARTRPYVTLGLIVLNIILFLYELSLSPGERTVFFYKLGLIPAELTSGKEFTQLLAPPYGVLDITSPWGAWGTVFSSMFVHGGFLHVAGNMMFLWVFGDNVEDRLGHLKYLLFYLAVGVAATWTQVALDMDSRVPNIGASGAIAGVLGAYLVLFPRSRINTLVPFYLITIVRLPAFFFLGYWFILQFFSGVGSVGAPESGGVAYWAHIGGFAAGVLAIVLYLKVLSRPLRPGRRRTPRRRPA